MSVVFSHAVNRDCLGHLPIGRGVVDIVGGLDAEGVGIVQGADKGGLGVIHWQR